MHPILFQIGPLPLHTYGALIVTGFFLGVLLLRKKAQLLKMNPEHITDIAFWALIIGLLGGRALFVITRWNEDYSKDPIRIFKLWEGGLVYYGGFIAGVAVFLYMAKKYNFKRLVITNMTAPSLAIAHAFGR
jgi:phosphatidylglycerol:prolipoprotein diacylglycerol transferase